ncbi:iron chelate uptake ABC transporter family permease subunit [Curvivirga sp.]|uniref:iron chelate uptake ABC transporter family permease subunit n=1 Tax=Curvivirga sp. TaxID=2856848 RepID=UPI003B5B66A1
MDDFLIRAIIIGLIIALIAGPIGCFVVWRRMAYFGDTMAHTALMGASFGLVLGADPIIGVLFTCFGFAILLFFAQNQRLIANDTLLGILAHGSLAAGIVLVSLIEDIRLDLMGYLFGDILAVDSVDIVTTSLAAIALFAILVLIWRNLIAITISETLARAEGLAVNRVRITYMLLIAAVIALSVQVIGMLLITALLIIPAAASRRLSKSPEQMAFFASMLGCIAVIAGLSASYQWDVPSGPAIVLSCVILFLTSIPFGKTPRVK